jgi:hypothetical protein
MNAITSTFKGQEGINMTETIQKSIIQEGIEIGEARGEARGKAEAGRNLVLRFLRAKFKNIPKEIEESVLGMSDPIALESLAEHAATSVTLDEFATAL